jgi:hypothetical protein
MHPPQAAVTPLLISRIHAEWEAHTLRHTLGGGWGTFRAIASVLQVAATLVLAFGFVLQFPIVLQTVGDVAWLRRLTPSQFELAMLTLVTTPEWLDVYFFGQADRVLRDLGVIKRLSSDPPPSTVPAEGTLRALWICQLLSRLSNLAMHVVFAVLLAGAIFYGVSNNFRDTPGMAGDTSSSASPSRR